jgi:hypothetical protein
MKFLFSRDIRELAHIRLALIFFNVAILAFWILNWPYEASTFGLTPAQVHLKLIGDAEAFASPMPMDALLLNVHVRLFLYTILLLTLSSVYFRLPLKQKVQLTVVSLAYSFVLFNMLSVILVRFVSDSFIWLKVLSFWGLQLSFFLMSAQATFYLLRPRKKVTPHVSHG